MDLCWWLRFFFFFYICKEIRFKYTHFSIKPVVVASVVIKGLWNSSMWQIVKRRQFTHNEFMGNYSCTQKDMPRCFKLVWTAAMTTFKRIAFKVLLALYSFGRPVNDSAPNSRTMQDTFCWYLWLDISLQELMRNTGSLIAYVAISNQIISIRCPVNVKTASSVCPNMKLFFPLLGRECNAWWCLLCKQRKMIAACLHGYKG